MKIYSIYEGNILLDFFKIPVGSHREIVNFYEDHRFNISELSESDQFKIQVCYVESLFELGKYKELLLQIDDFIEKSLEYNTQVSQLDIFYNLLYRKAVAHYQLGQIPQAQTIVKQLLAMDPDDTKVIQFYKHLLLMDMRYLALPSRVFFISGLLTTTLLMLLELLVIIPFFEDIFPMVSRIRNIIFISSISVFFIGEAARYVIMLWKTKVFLHQHKRSLK